LSLEDLKKNDRDSMFKTYDSWPDIAIESFSMKLTKYLEKDIDNIIFAGMGGSGSIGDTISAILSKKNIHVSVVKGYLLPKTISDSTLVVCISASGNTKETLTILDEAKKLGAKIVAFSSGGEMEEYCRKNKLFFQNISMDHSPRASFVRLLYSVLNVLESIIPIEKQDVVDSINELEKTKHIIDSNNLNHSNTSLQLAKWITKLPIIYYPNGLQSAAIRFKNSLQENAKIHVITEEIIESCHNGIVAWDRPSLEVKPVLLRGKGDYIETKKRWNILKEFFDEKNIEYFEIASVEGNILSKIVNLIYILDYASIYHSMLNGIDPTPVDAIDFIKNKLQ